MSGTLDLRILAQASVIGSSLGASSWTLFWWSFEGLNFGWFELMSVDFGDVMGLLERNGLGFRDFGWMVTTVDGRIGRSQRERTVASRSKRTLRAASRKLSFFS